MYAVEFQTTIKDDGTIDIPTAYRSHLKGTIRVILLTAEPTPKPSIIRQLLENPRRVANRVPFKRDEIYNRSL